MHELIYGGGVFFACGGGSQTCQNECQRPNTNRVTDSLNIATKFVKREVYGVYFNKNNNEIEHRAKFTTNYRTAKSRNQIIVKT